MTLPKKIAFVDIETTGSRNTYDRVIEIGIIRVEDGKVTKTFQSLINPDCYLPPEITLLTGITSLELESAPNFRQIKDEILEILDGCIFVAHNVRFDYSFLKSEFKRLNISFSPKHFCTVKLSRALYPNYKKHNLDSLIERFNFECPARHRALDDAKVLYQLYQKALLEFPEEKFKKALEKALKRPSIPLNLSQKILDSLPEKCGVYIFYGPDGMPLYIGKSICIRDRVLSHFSADHSSSLEMKISQQVKSIETFVTSGELGALFKEAYLIKKLQPLYNRKLRIARKLIVIRKIKDPNGYEKAIIENLTAVEVSGIDSILAIQRSKKQAKNFLIQIAKEFNLCEKLLSIDTTCKACFGYRLGRCKGACLGKETVNTYNLKFQLAFAKTKLRSWPFTGPIMIEEKDEEEGKIESHIFDKWCYLGCIKQDQEIDSSLLEKDLIFDLDSYKILNSYLRNPKNQKKIKLIKPDLLKRISLPFEDSDQTSYSLNY